VRVIGACSEPNKQFVVMEYMEMSLCEALYVHKIQMNDDVKLDLMAQMWSGLDFLHEMNIAHCDVKSANVLLHNVKDDDEGNGR
jgi:serine/threonine protein kinase